VDFSLENQRNTPRMKANVLIYIEQRLPTSSAPKSEGLANAQVKPEPKPEQ
jgi:hypothetical protein